jgi:hypothetical protein
MTVSDALAANIGDHDQILRQIVRALGEAGYLAHGEPKALTEDRRGRRAWRTPTLGPRGWPDIVAVRPADGRVIVAEVKTGKGRPTPEQRLWLRAWQEAAWRYPRFWVGIVGPSTLHAFYDAVLPEYKEEP